MKDLGQLLEFRTLKYNKNESYKFTLFEDLNR